MQLIIGVQNVEHVFDAYGEAQALSILSGFLNRVVFYVKDAATHNYIQHLFGHNSKREVNRAAVQSPYIVEHVCDADLGAVYQELGGRAVSNWCYRKLKLGFC